MFLIMSSSLSSPSLNMICVYMLCALFFYNVFYRALYNNYIQFIYSLSGRSLVEIERGVGSGVGGALLST